MVTNAKCSHRVLEQKKQIRFTFGQSRPQFEYTDSDQMRFSIIIWKHLTPN